MDAHGLFATNPTTLSANGYSETLPAVAITAGVNAWDIDQPTFANYSPSAGYYEIVTADADTNNLMDRIEFHIFDNDSPTWDSLNDHPNAEAVALYESYCDRYRAKFNGRSDKPYQSLQSA